VRQGPLRLRLCAPSATPDEAADPQAGARSEVGRQHPGGFPRGELGGGARLRGERLKRILARDGRQALAGFGSAKGSNEEAYLFQKLVRTGFGTNNVDHCTRLCHASSVAALLEGLGSGAVSNPVADVQHADVIVVIGANPTVNHPVAATWMKNAVERGATLIVMDPRETELARHATTHFLQFKPDSDVALLNAIAARHRHRGAGERRPSSPSAPKASSLPRATSWRSRPRRWRRSAASMPRRSAPWRAPMRRARR
jgi:hypothetical protein